MTWKKITKIFKQFFDITHVLQIITFDENEKSVTVVFDIYVTAKLRAYYTRIAPQNDSLRR